MVHLRNRNRVNGVGVRIIETGDIFETRTQCAEFLGVSPSTISMYFAGKVKNVRGYHLEFVEMDFRHPLTQEILDELYDLTGCDCEWREHPWRPDLYVSDVGLIAKNVRGRVVLKRLHYINSGYFVVSVEDYRTRVSKNGNQLVHRLVAETYIDNPDDKPYVNHKNGVKIDNRVENLEWSTTSENAQHAYDTGLHTAEYVRIVETGEVFRSMSECARAIGGSVSGIHDCKSGRQQKHRNYHFEFLEEGMEDFIEMGREPFYGVVVINKWNGDDAYFDSIREASCMLRFSRNELVDALSVNGGSVGDYYIEYAGREDRLLYGDEDNKLLSWIRIGIL